MFRERARRSPGACPRYHGEDSIEAKVDLIKPGGKAVNFPLCRLF
jgi:hypothetical protein